MSASRTRRILFIGHAAARCRDQMVKMSRETDLQFEVAEGGTIGVAMASTPPLFDAVFIAADLSDIDGAMLCARLRARGMHMPVLLLSDHGSEAEVIRGLDAGANDYICAPFRTDEILARLRAQIRAYESSEDAVLVIGPFQFRPARRLLHNTETGERVRLTEKEAAVLRFLYRAPGGVSRTTLLHEVWGYNAGVSTHTVETHIYRLRRKIEISPDQASLLVNENGGYRLCLEVRRQRPEWVTPVRELCQTH